MRVLNCTELNITGHTCMYTHTHTPLTCAVQVGCAGGEFRWDISGRQGLGGWRRVCVPGVSPTWTVTSRCWRRCLPLAPLHVERPAIAVRVGGSWARVAILVVLATCQVGIPALTGRAGRIEAVVVHRWDVAVGISGAAINGRRVAVAVRGAHAGVAAIWQPAVGVIHWGSRPVHVHGAGVLVVRSPPSVRRASVWLWPCCRGRPVASWARVVVVGVSEGGERQVSGQSVTQLRTVQLNIESIKSAYAADNYN